MHSSVPSFSVTLDATLLQLTVCLPFSSPCSLRLLPLHLTRNASDSLGVAAAQTASPAQHGQGHPGVFPRRISAACVQRSRHLTRHYQMQLSRASELVPESLAPVGRADLSTVISFVTKSMQSSHADPVTKDYAWFAVRPVSGAHVRVFRASIACVSFCSLLRVFYFCSCMHACRGRSCAHCRFRLLLNS
jgi:hypothetical protein